MGRAIAVAKLGVWSLTVFAPLNACMHAGVTARQRVCICNAPCRFSSKLSGANDIDKYAV